MVMKDNESTLELFRQLNSVHESAVDDVMSHYDKCIEPELREGKGSHYNEFYEVSKVLMETQLNPHSILDDGGWLSTWTSLDAFIHSFRHSCLDDGDHCYISCKTQGPKLVFCCANDYEPKELYFKYYPGLRRLYEEVVDYVRLEFEIHNDYKRFIREIKEEESTLWQQPG